MTCCDVRPTAAMPVVGRFLAEKRGEAGAVCAGSGAAGAGAAGAVCAGAGAPSASPLPAGSSLPTAPAAVVGRFAPTPSGHMHLGNALAALLAWSGVRAAGGRLVMRVEDLDPRAANAQVAQDLLADLAWLGLEWDGAPLYQSARGDAYREAVAYLARRGLVYPCFCSRQELHAASAPHASDGTYRYAGTCRGLSLEERARRSRAKRPALRVAVPATGEAGTIAFCDAVCGPQEETLAATCGDFLVRRSDGVYSYQLAVVVDDLFQGVNQVVRGNDLLGSTARQMWLARELAPCVLGTSGAASAAPATPPATTYAHVPLLTDSQGRRLCKRDGDLELAALRSRGVTPQAVLGFLAHALGLAEAGEPLDAAGFLRRFSWEAIAAAPRSIPVDASSLLA